MESTIGFTCLLGLMLPFVILYYNKGYLSANRFLAAFLFFASLYVLENFYFFYGTSLYKIAFFTCVHSFFYLIGPFAFLYVRSLFRDNSKLSKTDYLHFAFFVFSFIGYIPYFFSSWDYKLEVAQNISSENWDISKFHLNKIFYHKVDQVLNVLHTYFYSISLWYLIWRYKKKSNNPLLRNSQYKLIHNWLLVFASIMSIITIDFTVAMANVWLYDDKSIFLDRASVALLFASLVYIGMNMVIFFFPHIMYGLPIGMKSNTKDLQTALKDSERLLTEIHHRVKNNLHVINGLLQLQKEELVDPSHKAAFAEGQSRIESIALIHQNLYKKDNLASIEFHSFIYDLSSKVAKLYDTLDNSVVFTIPKKELFIDVDTAVPLGLIVNELLTNSYKNFDIKKRNRTICIEVKVLAKGQYELLYKDNGSGLPKDIDFDTEKTLGLKLIKGLAKQLSGNASYRYDKECIFTIFFQDSAIRYNS